MSEMNKCQDPGWKIQKEKIYKANEGKQQKMDVRRGFYIVDQGKHPSNRLKCFLLCFKLILKIDDICLRLRKMINFIFG